MSKPLHIGLVGPLPPPEGGMATQTRQLGELLRLEGIVVELLPTNAAYRPRWIENVRGLRAVFRLLPYLLRSWSLAGRVDLIHLMANSGWSWQLYSAPVIWIAWLRNTPVVVNYRGGEAGSYFARSIRWVRPSLRRAAAVVVPSSYLQQIFEAYSLATHVIPNIVNLERFKPALKLVSTGKIRMVITRNLEPIYGIETAIRALAQVKRSLPDIELLIAGTGPIQAELEALSESLEMGDAVQFVGRLGRGEIESFYRSADIMLNPTTVDNMPNSVLESMASGIPVISTDVGGVPHIVTHGKTALLVPVNDADAMAQAILHLCETPATRTQLRNNGLQAVQRYDWPRVRQDWLALYEHVQLAA